MIRLGIVLPGPSFEMELGLAASVVSVGLYAAVVYRAAALDQLGPGSGRATHIHLRDWVPEDAAPLAWGVVRIYAPASDAARPPLDLGALPREDFERELRERLTQLGHELPDGLLADLFGPDGPPGNASDEGTQDDAPSGSDADDPPPAAV